MWIAGTVYSSLSAFVPSGVVSSHFPKCGARLPGASDDGVPPECIPSGCRGQVPREEHLKWHPGLDPTVCAAVVCQIKLRAELVRVKVAAGTQIL